MLKSLNSESQNENNDIKNSGTRSKLIVFSKSFIQHVKEYMIQNINKTDFKPSIYYDLFKTSYEDLILREKTNIYSHICEINMNNKDSYISQYDELFEYKLKKMFKNQYFNMFKIQQKE